MPTMVSVRSRAWIWPLPQKLLLCALICHEQVPRVRFLLAGFQTIACSSLCLPLTFHIFKLYPSFKAALTSYLFYDSFSECPAKKEILQSPHGSPLCKKKKKQHLPCYAYGIFSTLSIFLFYFPRLCGVWSLSHHYNSFILCSIKHLNIQHSVHLKQGIPRWLSGE